jgi:hypothetical protein
MTSSKTAAAEIVVSPEQAEAAIGDGPQVHTFTPGPGRRLLGADEPREHVVGLLREGPVYQAVAIPGPGPEAACMRHGLAVIRDGDPLFIETKSDPVAGPQDADHHVKVKLPGEGRCSFLGTGFKPTHLRLHALPFTAWQAAYLAQTLPALNPGIQARSVPSKQRQELSGEPLRCVYVPACHLKAPRSPLEWGTPDCAAELAAPVGAFAPRPGRPASSLRCCSPKRPPIRRARPSPPVLSHADIGHRRRTGPRHWAARPCGNRLPEPPAGRAGAEKRLTATPGRIRLSI